MVLMIFNFMSLLGLLTIDYAYCYFLHLIVLDVLCLIILCIIYFFDTCKFLDQIVAFACIAFAADIGVGFFSYFLTKFVIVGSDKVTNIDISQVCTNIQVDSSNPIECTVCLENIVEDACELKECKHVFHKQCVQLWFQKFQTTCPNCRAQV